MIPLERYQNVPVAVAQSSVGQVLGIQGAVRQADVVENVVDLRSWNFLADLSLHQVEQARGFFNAHSGRAADMENELPAVGLGEEVFAKERYENESRKTKPEERRNEDASTEDESLQKRVVPFAHTLKNVLEALVKMREQPFGAGDVFLCAQQIHGQRRYQSSA